MLRKLLVMFSILAILAAVFGMNVSTARANEAVYVNHTVQVGETLGKISLQYCTKWQDIYSLNRDTIGKNPNVILPGMVLLVPSYCVYAVQLPGEAIPEGSIIDKGPMARANGLYAAPYYTIAWGDSLYSIGVRFGIYWKDIAIANGIEDTVIYAGRTLLIPDGSTEITAPPVQGSVERVYFQSGTTSASSTGIIYQGVPKNYILWARAGQTISLYTISHGEPLVISIGNTRGDLLPLIGVNSQIKNSVSVTLPESGDYIVTVRPFTAPENPQLAFDITFFIP